MNPPESRSLPGALWELIPPNWVAWDLSLQQRFSGWISDHPNIEWKIKWWTESPLAIALILLLLLGWAWKCVQEDKATLSRSQWLRLSLGTLALLGLSDLLSVRLKIWIGRMKPHVNFYNPQVLPALSLPSNHAFNTAFFWFLIYGALSPELRRRQKWALGLSAVIVFFVGLSRVVLGQHYPLDVICGWGLGGFFGIVTSRFYRSWILTAWRKRVPPRQSKDNP